MPSSRTGRQLLRGEEGRSLPFALVVVAVGALLVGPFLAHVSTSLLGSRAMQGGMNKEYAGDAGVEFGIWKLVNDSAFRSQVDSTPGTPAPLGPITVNQFTTNITVTLSGEWSTLADAPAAVGAGGALAYAGGDYIYALRGNNTRTFWRYSISEDSWLARANTPTGGNVGAGGALAYAGGYIYALRGNNTNAFWRYTENTWATRANTPANVGAGGALVYTGGDYIYALEGNTSRNFWRYSISNNSWVSMPNTPATVGDGGVLGGALTYDGAYIYAFRGTNSPTFWRFLPTAYEIVAAADGVTISARVVISGTDVTIQAWEIE